MYVNTFTYLGYGQTIGDDIGPAVIGIVIAHIGDGEGEG